MYKKMQLFTLYFAVGEETDRCVVYLGTFETYEKAIECKNFRLRTPSLDQDVRSKDYGVIVTELNERRYEELSWCI